MQILNENDLFNINGGSSILACMYHKLINVIRHIYKQMIF